MRERARGSFHESRQEAVSTQQQERLDRLLDGGKKIADEAFDYWLRALRWKTDKGFIGQWELEGNESGWGSYLVDASNTHDAFFSEHRVIPVNRYSGVTRREWNAVGKALARGDEPPVWSEFLYEGQHRVESGDLHGGVICLAIALESVLRTLLRKNLKRPAHPTFVEMLGFLSVGRIVEKWQEVGFWDAGWQQATNLPALDRLLRLRNRVMHQGDTRLDATECRSLARSVRTFINHAAPTAERLMR